MTLANIRLSYWAPNPAFLLAGRNYRLRCPGLPYLVREGLNNLSERAAYVNLSDGGHLENLGVYELLRRRCRLIIAVDAERDGQYTFDGLMTLQRFAMIDLGIVLDLDTSQLRLPRPKESPAAVEADANPEASSADAPQSTVHVIEGRIDYGKDGEGVFVYIKASLTGDETGYVAAYKARHPDYPHESTADQFFDEEQFEVYRALGKHIGEQSIQTLSGAFTKLDTIAPPPISVGRTLPPSKAQPPAARASERASRTGSAAERRSS
jgi:hypothetical protein